jgi:hypothetical protein
MHDWKHWYLAPDGEGTGGGDGGGTALLAGGEGDGAEKGSGSDGEGGKDTGTKESFFRGLYDESGKIDKTRFEALPEHLKPYRATYEKYDTIEALLGGTGNLASLAGKKGLQPLPEGADEKTTAEFHETLKSVLKIPETPEAYGIQKPDEVPDELWDEEFAKEAQAKFHELNIPPAAAKALVELDTQRAMKIHEQIGLQQAELVNKEKGKLHDAFGGEFDRKMMLAKQTAQKLGLDPEDPVFGNSSAVIIALTRAAAMIGEDRLVIGDSSSKVGMTHRQQALDIINNPANPKYDAYHSTNHPLHKQTVDETTELNRLASLS